jgi:transposase
MARFKHTDNSQGQLIQINLGEQLIPGTYEWTLGYLIDRMDLSAFDQNYRNDEMGAAAYPPRALLKAVLYCYHQGILSSRRIEEACRDNITTKALAEDIEPDHDTIASFIAANRAAIKELFTDVLFKCNELKLIRGEMEGLDGVKAPSNASKECSGTIGGMRKKREKLGRRVERMLARHEELDKSREARKILRPYRKTMGDDRKRRQRSIERLEKKLKRLDEFLASAEPRIGASGNEVQSNITDNESAKIKGPHGYIQGYHALAAADSGCQILVAAEATGSGEGAAFPQMLDSIEENLKAATGKEEPLKGLLCTADTGFFSEENLQEAARRGVNVLIPDPQFRQRDPDFGERKKERAKTKKRYALEDFEYDAGNDCYTCPGKKKLEFTGEVKLRNNEGRRYKAPWRDCVQCPHIEKCINLKHRKAKGGTRHSRTLYVVTKKYEENLSEKMKEKIDNPAYREIYSRRQQIIEPVFSDIVYCKGMDRFTLRGREKVDTQWKLYCIVHNIAKCAGH